jgi:hypothetical protein
VTARARRDSGGECERAQGRGEKGAVKARGGVLPFTGPGDSREMVVRSNNRCLMAHAIDGWGGLRRGFKKRNQGMGVMTWMA